MRESRLHEGGIYIACLAVMQPSGMIKCEPENMYRYMNSLCEALNKPSQAKAKSHVCKELNEGSPKAPMTDCHYQVSLHVLLCPQ